MSTMPQVCAAIIPTVTIEAELAGRDSGLVQRKRKLTGDKLSLSRIPNFRFSTFREPALRSLPC